MSCHIVFAVAVAIATTTLATPGYLPISVVPSSDFLLDLDPPSGLSLPITVLDFPPAYPLPDPWAFHLLTIVICEVCITARPL